MTLDLSSPERNLLLPPSLVITPEQGRQLITAANTVLREQAVESWKRLEELVLRTCDTDPNAFVEPDYHSDRATGAVLVYSKGHQRMIQIRILPASRITLVSLRRNHSLPGFEPVGKDDYGNAFFQRQLGTTNIPYIREEIDKLEKY
ncbi:MAG: hypothetical protein Q7R96_00080 [Nanoarchaeota archaeon]|nr:hypothetical protein [Nanoarchaeota archaeon]